MRESEKGLPCLKVPSRVQQQAITHLSGPALVIAGPGSGKTFVIIQRILYLINFHHVRPDKILVVTYTKAAAQEMKERFEAQILQQGALQQGVCFGTFHSVCFNILRQMGRASSNSLIRDSDRRKLFRIILGNRGLSAKADYDSITALSNSVSRLKNLTDPDAGSAWEAGGISFPENTDVAEEVCSGTGFTIEEIQEIRGEYDRYLREQGLLDFDDMVLECLRLLEKDQGVRRRYQFEQLLADEFQDVNRSQYRILKLLSGDKGNLFVVGDDDQAIYGFRGACPGIMRQFMGDFPKCRQILLTENYRSGGEIVTFSGKVISRNKERFVKEFYPVHSGGRLHISCFANRREEEQEITKILIAFSKDELQQTALILRTNREVLQYKEMLESAGIRVKGRAVSGEDIFHGFVMEDMEAFLSYLYQGGKRCDLLRFMNKPNRFFTREAFPFEKADLSYMEKYYAQNPEMLSEVRSFFRKLDIAGTLSPELALSFFRKMLGYDRYLHERAGDSSEYIRLLKQADQVQKCFKDYKTGTSVCRFIETFLENSGHKSPEMTTRQGLSILTMHGSKGLEFERVFLPDVNEGVIPGREVKSEKDHEEERRLLYVAITRAKRELFLFYTGERNRRLSRYLEGIIPHP